MLAAASGYRRGTNFRVSSTSTWYGDLQLFSWTHWSFPPLCLGRRACHCRGCPIRVYHNGIPDDVISPLARSREPVDSRSPRLNGPGPSDSITWSLPKDSVSGGRMAQAPCLPHGLFSGPVLAAVAASVPLPFPTPREILRPLRHAAISSHPSHSTSTRRVIQRVLQSSSLKHHEGVVFRPSFHPCVSRWFRDVYRPARH